MHINHRHFEACEGVPTYQVMKRGGAILSRDIIDFCACSISLTAVEKYCSKERIISRYSAVLRRSKGSQGFLEVLVHGLSRRITQGLVQLRKAVFSIGEDRETSP